MSYFDSLVNLASMLKILVSLFQYYKELYLLILIILDVNECEVNNGGCEQLCENISGSFRCSCFKGWRRNLSKPGACEDINECLSNNGKVLYVF